MSPDQDQTDLSPQIIKSVIQAVEKVCEEQCNKHFSQDPENIQRDIIEYNSRMRVSAQEKFNGPCFISVVNFYMSDDAKKQNDSCGALIVYIKEEEAADFLKPLGEPGQVADSPEVIEKNLKTFTQTLGDQLKGGLANQGLRGLVSSDPEYYVNLVPNGVAFNYRLYTYQDFSFYFKKEKILSVDFTILSP
jgi:hypothetical protein